MCSDRSGGGRCARQDIGAARRGLSGFRGKFTGVATGVRGVPRWKRPRAAPIEINPKRFEDGGFGIAVSFTGPIHDVMSLRELREAIRMRGPRGIAEYKAQIDRLQIDSSSPVEQIARAGQLHQVLGLILMYDGQHAEAARCFERGAGDRGIR